MLASGSRFSTLALAAFWIVVGAPRIAEAQIPTGPPVEIRSSPGSELGRPQVVALSDGRFVVIWFDSSAPNPSFQVLGRMGESGPTGLLTDVSTIYPVGLASDSVGGFLLAWFDDQVWVARYDSAGRRIEGPSAPFDIALNAFNPSVAFLENGSIVVFGDCVQFPGPFGSRGPCFVRTDGALRPLGPSTFVGNFGTGTPSSERVVALRGGGFAIAFVFAPRRGFGADSAQTFDDDGNPLGSLESIGQGSEWFETPAAIVALPDGGFAAAWIAMLVGAGDPPPMERDLFLRFFSRDGAPKGDRILASPPNAVETTSGDDIDLSGDSDGSLTIVWRATAAEQSHLYLHLVDAAGTFETPEQVIAEAPDSAGSPRVAASNFRGLMVTWLQTDSPPHPPSSLWSLAYLRLCSPADPKLLLRDGRFEVCAGWRTPQGHDGVGQPLALTDFSGSFWFFDSTNRELIVKVLDGCVLNDHLWFFTAGLTNVDVSLAVIDTWTGKTWTSISALGTTYTPIQDTTAFDTCDARPPASSRSQETATASGREEEPARSRTDVAFANSASQADPHLEPLSSLPGSTRACVPGDTDLCFDQGRFRVEATFDAGNGLSGSAKAISLSDQSGIFWFFVEGNIELFAKLLDACSGFDRFWFFVTGLTNVEVHVTVTDTLSSSVRHYDNSLHQAFEPVLDTSAFATCAQ